MPHAAVVVGHGGYGTTLGTLRRGVPLVVVPLFSADQWANAAAAAAAGAAVALDAERDDPPRARAARREHAGRLRPAVERVLDDPSFRRSAERIAAAMRALPPVDAAVDALRALAARPSPVNGAGSFGDAPHGAERVSTAR